MSVLNRLLVFGSCLMIFLGLAACAPVTNGPEIPPPPDGIKVKAYITNINPYQQWAFWPGKGKMYEGQHPHGAYLTTYVSNGAVPAITNRSGQIPPHEYIVKENYSPAKELVAVTVMYKVPGYYPQAGDWFWMKYDAKGFIEEEGKIAGCIECHQSVRSNDWLFTGPVQ